MIYCYEGDGRCSSCFLVHLCFGRDGRDADLEDWEYWTDTPYVTLWKEGRARWDEETGVLILSEEVTA